MTSDFLEVAPVCFSSLICEVTPFSSFQSERSTRCPDLTRTSQTVQRQMHRQSEGETRLRNQRRGAPVGPGESPRWSCLRDRVGRGLGSQPANTHKLIRASGAVTGHKADGGDLDPSPEAGCTGRPGSDPLAHASC